LIVEILFRQAGVFHREARRPGKIFRGGLFWLAGFAAEPIRGRLADPDDGGFSSYAHVNVLSLSFEQYFSSVDLSSQLTAIRLSLTVALCAWDNLWHKRTG
jgi:hypothetical protein